MFEQLTEQFQSAMKPANNLMAVNIQTFEKLTQQQTALLSGVVNDTMAYTKGLSSQKDVSTYMETNKCFLEGLQEKFTSAAKDVYGILSEAQEQSADTYKDLFSHAVPAAKSAPKSAPKAS